MRRCNALAWPCCSSSSAAPPSRQRPPPSRTPPSETRRRHPNNHHSMRHRPKRHPPRRHLPKRHCPTPRRADQPCPRLRCRRRRSRRRSPNHARRGSRLNSATRAAEPSNRYACWANWPASCPTATAANPVATNATAPASACTKDPIPRRPMPPAAANEPTTPAGAERPSTTGASSRGCAWTRLEAFQAQAGATAASGTAIRYLISARATRGGSVSASKCLAGYR
jgi:hypothetical protein